MVQALASRGADLNVKGTWRIATGAAVTLQALQVAAASGHEDVVLSLLSREAIKVDATVKGGRTVLHVAASCGQDRVVRRLLLNEQVTLSIHREACVGRGCVCGAGTE
jgi:ankyrin repeat protein